MKIAFFGAGGVGGYFFGRLAQAGKDVVCIARGKHLAAMIASGLRVDSIAGNLTVHPARVTDSAASIGKVDLVVLATKAWQVREAITKMEPLVGASTRILPLLNGIEHIDWLQAAYGHQRVLGGISRISAYLEGPGHIKHVAVPIPAVVIGSFGADNASFVDSVRTEISDVEGMKLVTPANIRAAMWEKLLFISATGGVGALAKRPIGEWRHDPFYREQAIAAMEETVAVACAHGIEVTNEAVVSAMANVDNLNAVMTPSMQKDIEHGHPSELDAQVGAIIRYGRAAGVATPTHESIYQQLLPLEQAARLSYNAPLIQMPCGQGHAMRS